MGGIASSVCRFTTAGVERRWSCAMDWRRQIYPFLLHEFLFRVDLAAGTIALGLLARFFQHHLHRPILASTLACFSIALDRAAGVSIARAGDSHRDRRWVIPWRRWSATRPGRLNTIEKSEEVATLGPRNKGTDFQSARKNREIRDGFDREKKETYSDSKVGMDAADSSIFCRTSRQDGRDSDELIGVFFLTRMIFRETFSLGTSTFLSFAAISGDTKKTN
ncbi:uncharacterized protein LOC112351185 isoform X2 [Selaginella moellendorffii]|uniref:uncharacterized protein LOC112351185 isoform X2 n=1 Tax=Selaginella moellendorffii TaxID=88036 RepID=UPI000D1C29E2|nr:uncharacterized protein LOC112351185 isoform X2 [Selaginella moellendorffii]|eukprot:XP_024544323.1 uncharacterized protein LOC112351185 isoform X2 [Selaginella moellendorffii]